MDRGGGGDMGIRGTGIKGEGAGDGERGGWEMGEAGRG